MASNRATGAYAAILEAVFLRFWRQGMNRVEFGREDLRSTAAELGHTISNLGDIVYSFRYRRLLPPAIEATAPEGQTWLIRGLADGRYAFCLAAQDQPLAPDPTRLALDVPEATPGLITRYALQDEQALLAKVRYNRLIDLFTGVVCYSLQNHLRSKVQGLGQVEVDEIYVGVDRHGAHYVFPVQAKGGNDRLSVIQVEQDMALCRERFPDLICQAIAAQFMPGGVVALFSLTETDDGLRKVDERHYRLVPPDQISAEALHAYRQQSLRDASAWGD